MQLFHELVYKQAYVRSAHQHTHTPTHTHTHTYTHTHTHTYTFNIKPAVLRAGASFLRRCLSCWSFQCRVPQQGPTASERLSNLQQRHSDARAESSSSTPVDAAKQAAAVHSGTFPNSTYTPAHLFPCSWASPAPHSLLPRASTPVALHMLFPPSLAPSPQPPCLSTPAPLHTYPSSSTSSLMQGRAPWDQATWSSCVASNTSPHEGQLWGGCAQSRAYSSAGNGRRAGNLTI